MQLGWTRRLGLQLPRSFSTSVAEGRREDRTRRKKNVEVGRLNDNYIRGEKKKGAALIGEKVRFRQGALK